MMTFEGLRGAITSQKVLRIRSLIRRSSARPQLRILICLSKGARPSIWSAEFMVHALSGAQSEMIAWSRGSDVGSKKDTVLSKSSRLFICRRPEASRSHSRSCGRGSAGHALRIDDNARADATSIFH